MTLQELKQEARENSYATMELTLGPEKVMHLVDVFDLIDKVVDAVEASVVPKTVTKYMLDDDFQNAKWMGQNEARDAVLEAFRNFRA